MALTDSHSATVDTWSHPRGLELPGLGSDGGGAPTARGLLGATECAWKLGQAQGSQLAAGGKAVISGLGGTVSVPRTRYIKSDSTTENTALFRGS